MGFKQFRPMERIAQSSSTFSTEYSHANANKKSANGVWLNEMVILILLRKKATNSAQNFSHW